MKIRRKKMSLDSDELSVIYHNCSYELPNEIQEQCQLATA